MPLSYGDGGIAPPFLTSTLDGGDCQLHARPFTPSARLGLGCYHFRNNVEILNLTQTLAGTSCDVGSACRKAAIYTGQHTNTWIKRRHTSMPRIGATKYTPHISLSFFCTDMQDGI
jgi:hypothetical protein